MKEKKNTINPKTIVKVKLKVTQLCLTLCIPMNCSLPCSSVHGDSPGKNTGVCSHSVLQVIFPTQVYSLQADSLLSEPLWKHKNTKVGSLSLLQWIFLTQESKQFLLHCRQILYELSYQGRQQYVLLLLSE